jgi:hypothetical protein
MMRILIAILAFSSVCAAESALQRLARAAKLWGHIKYIHPRVTSADVDWDAAFATAAPAILAAQTDEEAADAVRKMLSALRDPATRLFEHPEAETECAVFVVSDWDGATVVSLRPGDMDSSFRQPNLWERLPRGSPVVFDFRDARNVPTMPFLRLGKAVIGPSYLFRMHSGYPSPHMITSGGYYRSSWDVWDGIRMSASVTQSGPFFLSTARR